ncbi:hypothetical protein VTI74DRAFT_1830 [Chaetomium olivicolor]
MLDRTASDQYHYYQPGIGTYVVSNSLTHTGTVARMKSWYMKAKDSAIGSSFDQHVVGGYRFLMRFYNPGDEIYIFGFSRGAYIARFLAEMLDYVGLLSHGNEEMVVFTWKAFSNWQSRQGSKTPEGIKKQKEMYAFMKGFRETFSRPVRRIRFLGLFDTVNSVPRFETAWMGRSKFPYTARTSAKVIRHAVSIDERRAKFRQDLIYQSGRSQKARERTPAEQNLREIHDKHRGRDSLEPGASKKDEGRADRGRQGALEIPNRPAPYRARSHSIRSPVTHITEELARRSMHTDARSEVSVAPHPHDKDHDVDSLAESEDETDQDIDEVWFAGGHADIGGGWEMLPESKSASHVPLVWMVREAIKAGLRFDIDKVREMGCIEALDDACMTGANGDVEKKPNETEAQDAGKQKSHPLIPDIIVRSDSEMMHKAYVARIHDSLDFGGGLSWSSVLAWKIMEYLPFRRMDLQPDGSWKPIRWPLPCGEVRDIPADARVHGSVIRRMQLDPTYRPGNLIIGGGGRGKRRAPEDMGIGEWDQGAGVKNRAKNGIKNGAGKATGDGVQQDGGGKKRGRWKVKCA